MTFPKEFCLARLANLDAEEIEYRKHLDKSGVEDMLALIRVSRQFWLRMLDEIFVPTVNWDRCLVCGEYECTPGICEGVKDEQGS